MAREARGAAGGAIAALADAVSALARAAGALDHLLPRLDDEQRRLAVGLVGDVGRASDALQLRIADDLVQRHEGLPKDERFPVTSGYRDPLDMLTAELGIAHGAGKRLLRAVATLRPRVSLTGGTVPARFPVLGDAVASGAVSIDQASAIIDGLGDAPDRADPTHLAAAERALVDSALGRRGTHPAETGIVEHAMPPTTLGKVARAWRDALDPDGVEPRYEDLLRERALWMRTRSDGALVGKFVCPPDQGAVLLAGLDAFTSPRTPGFLDEEERARAEAAARTDDRSRPQKMIDALVAIVGRAVEQRDVPRVGGEAPVVVLHLSEATFRAAAAGQPGGTALDERTGEPIPMHIAQARMCDARIQAVVTGPDGVPLYLGRERRLFSRHQRRAIAARDKGCRAPGCTVPVGWTECHHIVPWLEGGPTDVDNGILLCTHHHHEVHRGTLEIIQGPRGWVVVPKTRAPRRRRGWAALFDPDDVYLQPAA